VDLRSQADDRWTAPRQPTETAQGWGVRWPRATAPLAMSPWTRGGDPTALRPHALEAGTWRLPRFRRWIVLHDPASVSD
jgi:hypothetical protein